MRYPMFATVTFTLLATGCTMPSTQQTTTRVTATSHETPVACTTAIRDTNKMFDAADGLVDDAIAIFQAIDNQNVDRALNLVEKLGPTTQSASTLVDAATTSLNDCRDVASGPCSTMIDYAGEAASRFADVFSAVRDALTAVVDNDVAGLNDATALLDETTGPLNDARTSFASASHDCEQQ